MDGVEFAPFARRACDDGSAAVLPTEAPLAMPEQSLRVACAAPERLASTPSSLGSRRTVFFGLILAMTAVAAWTTCRALAVNTLGPLDFAILSVFVCLFAWTALSFVTALAGLWTRVRRQDDPLGITEPAASPLSSRIAVLAPIFNEEVPLVFARLQAIMESIDAAGEAAWFDLFILSDTTDPTVLLAEASAFELLRRRIGRPAQVFYGHRPDNQGRKAGNVAEWVRRFGGAYPLMVVLDADSLMTGETMIRLGLAMQLNPGVGLIQTSPVIAGRRSLFGRLHQFANRAYGPMMAQGLAWWSGSEANYWGHNAVIRVRAFAAHAGLPNLSGRGPFGGAILSHDFVEAALIRRAGWAVHMAPQLGGTYEECPPTLAGYLQRDRRWCQGNLQHLRLITARGLHWVSRLHLLSGALAYLSAPLWLALLGMSVLLAVRPDLGAASPVMNLTSSTGRDLAAAGLVCGVSFTFLLAPRLVAGAIIMADPVERRLHGGARAVAASVAFEVLTSSLIAPVMMLSQTGMIVDLLRGRDSGWRPQRRSETSIGLAELCRHHLWHMAIGAGLGAAVLAASPMALLLISPAILGLILSVPVAGAVARCDLGQAAKRLGLLLAPAEVSPPSVVIRAAALVGEYRQEAVQLAPRPRRPMAEPRSFDPRSADLVPVVGALSEHAPIATRPSAAPSGVSLH